MDLVLLGDTIDEILLRITSLETTGRSGIGLSKSKIEGLTKALQEIRPAVKKLHLQDRKAPGWLRDLKNAINDLTDSLEGLFFAYVLAQAQHEKLAFFKPTTDPLKDRFRAVGVNQKIKNVIGILQKVKDECLKMPTPMPTPMPSQEAHEKIQDRELDPAAIGRQKEKKQIIDQIMPFRASDVAPIPYASDVIPNYGESDATPILDTSDVTNLGASDVPIPLVTIVGFAGIGKKELVRLICEDKEVEAHFGLPIRVPDVDSFENCVVSRPQTNKKHYLVVMEDLKTEIEELNEEESWSLFWRIHGPNSISVMGEIEQKIVMDCGGVPLLIKFTTEFLNNLSGANAALKKEFLKKLKL
ncbi:hypothetical protein P8452_46709 [Trifolium repens]|nr:hypothetical protein P8452_46709 [Trifolium repens]